MATITFEQLQAAREAAITLLFAAGGLIDAAISPDGHPWEGDFGPSPLYVQIAATLGERLAVAGPAITAAIPTIIQHGEARGCGSGFEATTAHEAAMILARRVWQTICEVCGLSVAEGSRVELVRAHWSNLREPLARDFAHIKSELLVHEVRAESDRVIAVLMGLTQAT